MKRETLHPFDSLRSLNYEAFASEARPQMDVRQLCAKNSGHKLERHALLWSRPSLRQSSCPPRINDKIGCLTPVLAGETYFSLPSHVTVLLVVFFNCSGRFFMHNKKILLRCSQKQQNKPAVKPRFPLQMTLNHIYHSRGSWLQRVLECL